MCVRVLRVSGFLRVHGNSIVIPCDCSYYDMGCGRRWDEKQFAIQQCASLGSITSYGTVSYHTAQHHSVYRT